MSRDFRIGDLVIASDTDQPCGRLVAVVVGFEIDGVQDFCLCQYLNIDTDFDRFNNPPMRCNSKLVTKLSDFGCALVTNTKNYYVVRVGRSNATYRDGAARDWQETTPMQFQGRPNLMSRIRDNVFYEHF